MFVHHKSKADRVVDAILYTVLILFSLAALFPIYYVFVMSVTPIDVVLKNGGFVIFPEKMTWEGYKAIFESPVIPQSLKVSVFVTVVGTALNVIVTTLLAYPLSKKQLPGRNFFLFIVVFTMLFSGGIIPQYLVVRATGLLNTVWALIIPGLVSAFNLLIMKTFFENLPEEIEDAAKVDGCGELQTLFRIVLPLSKPIMATMALFYGIQHWNAYFQGIMYITDKTLYPMQVVLRNMLQAQSVSQELLTQNPTMLQQLPPETLQMAAVVVTILPVIVIYPFVQKYFVKGFLLGSIKE
ncbi:carbohydrate ABC transporter permease [Paenactinomyces guangxiensis]|uniref:Carbohydrate ABC transporter permease n=1 Tax=Paenactinomyces guangxiensis TaxID=1490290 RepID=A0A7W1WVA6_9BACL|nr:carbohydrate ABC transporter permease [Paenactinomyces guangxiensis]MBA4496481.1 carbohydrate ABC transporter permease [Paenactinomyces guangxiensis]MBH8593593.1 carbohydrate ABC transporter permease [Paenactinomyces guangxiensis]